MESAADGRRRGSGRGRPRGDIVDDAMRILGNAREAGVTMRLLGGVAIGATIPSDARILTGRAYQDIDFACADGQNRQVTRVMAAMEYEVPEQFNALNGARRLLFFDRKNDRQIDVFVGAFVMCHTIPLAARLTVCPDTIPLAELLLTKLQIVELNQKDHVDILTLLYHHTIGEDDGAGINGRRIAELCGRDWGLWRTVQLNLERTAAWLREMPTASECTRERILGQVHRLEDVVARSPKTVRWKMRSRVGDRVKWYEEPEEVR